MGRLVSDATGNDLTYRRIGAAMTVHNVLGPGYKEEAYERALTTELGRTEIVAEAQFPVDLLYEGRPAALFFLDIYVERLVVVEVKAFSHQLTNDEVAQVLNYLKATAAPVGLLFNFGRRRLEFKRIFPSSTARPRPRLGRDDVYKTRWRAPFPLGC